MRRKKKGNRKALKGKCDDSNLIAYFYSVWLKDCIFFTNGLSSVRFSFGVCLSYRQWNWWIRRILCWCWLLYRVFTAFVASDLFASAVSVVFQPNSLFTLIGLKWINRNIVTTTAHAQHGLIFGHSILIFFSRLFGGSFFFKIGFTPIDTAKETDLYICLYRQMKRIAKSG